jgi:hypothetical protein
MWYVGLGFGKREMASGEDRNYLGITALVTVPHTCACFSFILSYHMYSCFSKKKLQLLACCYCLPLWLRNCRQFSSSRSSLLLPHSNLTKSLILQVRFLVLLYFQKPILYLGGQWGFDIFMT